MKSVVSATPETIGRAVDKIPVEVSTRFLEHFSEQLYSSPQKAFEELISNGWDAGAAVVDVRISEDLKSSGATMAVVDNGISMDADGLRDLWHIAFSPKRDRPIEHGRPVIGKFGIGKLATYVLARKLTYICKATDGVIRRVTMDFGSLDTQKGANTDCLISELELDIFEVEESEVETALGTVADGAELWRLLTNDFSNEAIAETAQGDGAKVDDSEFGGTPAQFNPPDGSTWTLVILSELKRTGQELKLGVLRRMLEAALPFGSEIAIRLNGDRLSSSKLSATLTEQWVIGPSLGIDYVELDEDGELGPPSTTAPGEARTPKLTRIQVSSGSHPYPYVDLPEVGRLTGFAKLFHDKISGGKSEERGASNGFHINVLGRVVNQGDPSFGEDNLNHAAWARFRMTVRADELNQYLTTNREQFKERRGLKIFRAFLRRVFNKARTVYDSDIRAAMPDGGDVLVKSLGVLSLNPLRSVVSETLRTQSPIQGLFDESGISDREERRKSWREDTADNIRNALGEVKFEKPADSRDHSFVKFRISDNTVIVNKNHNFVMEHSHTRAEKELIRTIALVSLLADVYAIDIGVEPAALQRIREYRDRLMRFRALQRRESGVHIARLLLETQHQSDVSKRMEAAVADAVRHLDFDVLELGMPGEPEGIASAFPLPTKRDPTTDNPQPPLYSFSFDAKSTKYDVAATGNVHLDAIVEHRDNHKADYALVVAPGFSDGALARRCKKQGVTPMKASDLGRLLEYTAEFGTIPVTKFREVFKYHDPEEVTRWVDELPEGMMVERRLTINVFLEALKALKGKVPDVLSASTIALTCRDQLRALSVKDNDVIALVRGLQVIVPDLVGINDDKVVVNASAERVAAAIAAQLDELHPAATRGGKGLGSEATTG